jgi:hypothetical protein
VSRIVGPQKAWKPHDFSGFNSVYAKNPPTNSFEEAEIMDRLKSIARRYGLNVLVCACKNPNIASGSCHISGRWPPAARENSQLGLFRA